MAMILIQQASAVLTGNDATSGALNDIDILIQDDKIKAMGQIERTPDMTLIDGRGSVVYPGFVNTHHHLFQSMLKGVPEGLNVPLFEWLQAVPYRYGPYFDEETIEVSATIGMVELLLSGCTTVADHHYLYGQGVNFDPNEILFNVAEKLGMRFVLLRGGATVSRTFATSERLPMPTESIDEFLSSITQTTNKYHDPSPQAFRKVVLAPSTPFYSCTPSELKLMAQEARHLGIRLHSHLSETVNYVDYARDVLKDYPVHWCAKHDWIGPDVSFAHMVHLNDAEIALCGQTETAIAHCPQSNGRLGSGIAPILKLMQAGATVGIGVDGAASNEAADMVSELHAAWLIHRSINGAEALPVQTLVNCASANGAKILGLDNVGILKPGMQADLVIYQLDHPRYLGNHDPATAIITAGGAPHIQHAFVAGREVVRDGVIPGLDLERLVAQSNVIIKKLKKNY